MAELTECSICMEVYTNPKILPCVHTFCLECLKKCGRDKKTGDQMSCPICRNEFLIPDGGLGSLPDNFFIVKMVEIQKLSETPTYEALCRTCSTKVKVKAKMFCFECDRNLCEGCSITHSKMKLYQYHQVVVLGNKLKLQEINAENSCCDKHPGVLAKMFCEDDKATICIRCFAESHQTHKCLSVAKASEEFLSALKDDLKMVLEKLTEFQTLLLKCDKWKKHVVAQIADTDKQILDEAVRLKVLIHSHANVLRGKLTTLREERLIELESMKQYVKRRQIAAETYRECSKELLSKGTPGDICREAHQLKTRAHELASLSPNFFHDRFHWDGVIFKSLNFKDVLLKHSIDNVIGDVQDGTKTDCSKPPATSHAVKKELERMSEVVLNLKPHQLDLIRTEEFKKKLKHEVPDLEIEVKHNEVKLRGIPDDVARSRLYVLEKLTAVVQDAFEISSSIGKVFAKEETKTYLMEHFLSKGISASWMCKGRNVFVFASDDENLEDAVKFLKNEVVEARLNLDTVHLTEEFGQSPLWKGFVRSLCEEDRLLEVNVSESVITAACLRISFEKTKRRIEDFFFRNSLNGKDMLFRLAMRNKWQ